MTKSDMIKLRIEPRVKEQLRSQAATAGLALSEYVRQAVLAPEHESKTEATK